MRGAQFDAIVVQSRANGGKAVPNFRQRSDRGVLDDSVHSCGRAFGSMSALGGIRSCRRRMSLRNTLFVSQSNPPADPLHFGQNLSTISTIFVSGFSVQCSAFRVLLAHD